MNVNPIMAAIVEAAETLNTAPEDYINPDDGLKYCGKCHTPKEAYFPEQYRKNGLDKHPIACKCASEEQAQREAEQRKLEWLNRIAMLRSEAFRDIPAAGWRFENADVMTPQLVKAKAYSENWDEFRREGIGLTLPNYIMAHLTSRTSMTRNWKKPIRIMFDKRSLGIIRGFSVYTALSMFFNSFMYVRIFFSSDWLFPLFLTNSFVSLSICLLIVDSFLL